MSESFVLDCSLSMAWCFDDEAGSYATRVLDQAASSAVHVPAIWPLEVVNVLAIAERKKRITPAHSAQFLKELHTLRIQVDPDGLAHVWTEVLQLARAFATSAYDAAYLELAMRLSTPLATLDDRLQKAAHQAGVKLFVVE